MTRFTIEELSEKVIELEAKTEYLLAIDICLAQHLDVSKKQFMRLAEKAEAAALDRLRNERKSDSAWMNEKMEELLCDMPKELQDALRKLKEQVDAMTHPEETGK